MMTTANRILCVGLWLAILANFTSMIVYRRAVKRLEENPAPAFIVKSITISKSITGYPTDISRADNPTGNRPITLDFSSKHYWRWEADKWVDIGTNYPSQ